MTVAPIIPVRRPEPFDDDAWVFECNLTDSDAWRMSGKMRLMFMRITVVAVILMLCIGSGFTQTTPDKSRRENLDLQERCGTQAQKVFKQLQAENEAEGKRWKLPSNMQTVSADYQSHYNAPLNRCFMTVLDTMSNGSISKWLIDAFENRQYAFYFWIPDPKGISCFGREAVKRLEAFT